VQTHHPGAAERMFTNPLARCRSSLPAIGNLATQSNPQSCTALASRAAPNGPYVWCRCGHQASGLIGLIAWRAGMGGHERLWRLVVRLRCSRCGARDPDVEVGR
jgi:hypothetical protein